jgi:hypothetical protein
MANDKKIIEPIDGNFDAVARSLVSGRSVLPMKAEDDAAVSLTTKRAEYSGTLALGDIELSCFVTADGERFISGRSMTGAIGMKGRGQGMARISTNLTLKPFMNNDLVVAIEQPVLIIGKTPKPVHGYRAEILADLCDSLLEARAAGALKTEQEARYGQFAEVLVRAFARVGITALVDEATGYQYDRKHDALSMSSTVIGTSSLSSGKGEFPKVLPYIILVQRSVTANAEIGITPRSSLLVGNL